MSASNFAHCTMDVYSARYSGGNDEAEIESARPEDVAAPDGEVCGGSQGEVLPMSR